MRAIRLLSFEAEKKRFERLRTDNPVILARREKPKSSNALSFRPRPKLYQDCGHTDAVLADIRVPDSLLPYCEEKGWIASVKTWEGRVVVVRHPSVELGVDAPVTPSNRCPECVLQELRRELAHIKANAVALQKTVPVEEPPSHARPQIKRRRKSA